MADELLDQSTRRVPVRARARAAPKRPVLTVLAHPDWSRAGEVAPLPALDSVGAEVRISRVEPAFVAASTGREYPLADPFVSRSGPTIRALADGEGFAIDASESRTPVEVDGTALTGTLRVASSALDEGVVVALGDRTALLLHRRAPRRTATGDLGILGESDAIAALRDAILRVADLDASVLVRGPSGSGKELVARALHDASPRRSAALVALDAASIPAQLAGSELFGHVRGAFSGADSAREGAFRRAHGGTLFLDEIGELGADVQVQLLRTLETSEVRPLGSDRVFPVRVRVVAATDADLEKAVDVGEFRAPLLYRLAAHEIRVPALRERRDDVGRLLVHFLAAERRALGLPSHPDPSGPTWLPAQLVARLAAYDWPGNVRELRNVARRLAALGRSGEPLPIEPEGLPLLSATGARAAAEADAPPSEDALIEALRACEWNIGAAARRLGVARSSVYYFIDRSERVRKAKDVPRAEIEAALATATGDVRGAARALEVSPRALKLRMKALGLAP